MRSTGPTQSQFEYLGADVTDRYSRAARPIDVCGVQRAGRQLTTQFWTWTWDRAPAELDVEPLLPEIRAARFAMLDAPQALAASGSRMRECERLLRAAGKTGDRRPDLDRPYAGFVRSSLDLFAALHASHLRISPTDGTGVFEVYPAAIWTRLTSGLPNKMHVDGQRARIALLRAMGISLPNSPTHDQLDACAGALLGLALDGRIEGLGVARIGAAVTWDPTLGVLREGPILVPEPSTALRQQLHEVARPWTKSRGTPSTSVSRAIHPPPAHKSERRPPFRLGAPTLEGETPEARAIDLLNWLIAEFGAGRPTLCSYAAAVRLVLRKDRYAQGYGQQLTRLARSGDWAEVDGLGRVFLDTFIVNRDSHTPGNGHWLTATYTESDWLRAFSDAELLHP